MRLFVIHEHTTDERVHYDLMLERFFSLHTWSLDSPPSEHVECDIVATRIQNHRKMYLDYEGPISGGRGSVRIWDSGTYEILRKDFARLVFNLTGSRLHGIYRLQLWDKLERLWVFTGPVKSAADDLSSQNLDIVSLVEPNSLVEAELFRSALLDQGITCSFQPSQYLSHLYNTALQARIGRIVVFQKDFERAAEIISELRDDGHREG